MKKKACDVQVGDDVLGAGVVTQVDLNSMPKHVVLWFKKRGVTNDLMFPRNADLEVKAKEA